MTLHALPWRDSARTVRIAFLDARAVSGLVLWLFHMRWWTFWLSLAVMLLFLCLERWGLSLPAALRLARLALFGPVRSHESAFSRRRCLR